MDRKANKREVVKQQPLNNTMGEWDGYITKFMDVTIVAVASQLQTAPETIQQRKIARIKKFIQLFLTQKVFRF